MYFHTIGNEKGGIRNRILNLISNRKQNEAPKLGGREYTILTIKYFSVFIRTIESAWVHWEELFDHFGSGHHLHADLLLACVLFSKRGCSKRKKKATSHETIPSFQTNTLLLRETKHV